MEEFEQAISKHRSAIERYVRFRISSAVDADDVLQEVYSAALKGYESLQCMSNFKSWLIHIARNKCADYLRRKYRNNEVLLVDVQRIAVIPQRFAVTRDSLVLDTMEKLSEQDRQILHLCYWLELPQQEIARRLGLPLGTVKSRLHNARERFRAAFPMQPKGASNMPTIMPKILPDYTITPSELPPFECKWEELMGWFIVPKLGENFPGQCMTFLNASVQRQMT